MNDLLHIGISLSVLADVEQGYAVYHNTAYGTEIAVKNIRTVDPIVTYNIDEREMAARRNEFYKLYFGLVHPVPGSGPAVQALRANYSDITVFCDCSDKHVDVIRSWIEEIFDGWKPALVFRTENNVRSPLNDLIVSRKVDVHIGDNPILAQSLAQTLVESYMLRRPWNEDSSPFMVEPQFDWEEAVVSLAVYARQ